MFSMSLRASTFETSVRVKLRGGSPHRPIGWRERRYRQRGLLAPLPSLGGSPWHWSSSRSSRVDTDGVGGGTLSCPAEDRDDGGLPSSKAVQIPSSSSRGCIKPGTINPCPCPHCETSYGVSGARPSRRYSPPEFFLLWLDS